MRIRFQADADLDGRILRGLRRAKPDIDIQSSAVAGLAGLDDIEVLRIAANAGRVLVSQDRCVPPFRLRPQIEELSLIWSASDAEEWIGRLLWIPL